MDFPGGVTGEKKKKKKSASAGDLRDMGSIPGSGRPPGGRHGNLLQWSCLENPIDRNWADYSPWVHKELDMTSNSALTQQLCK